MDQGGQPAAMKLVLLFIANLSDAESALDGGRCAVNHKEVRTGRSLRLAPALFPVPQSVDAESKSGCERVLGHSELPSDRLHIDMPGHVDAISLLGSMALRISHGLFQALTNAGCRSAHCLGLRYVSTKSFVKR
jgi:hypothetical protein